MNSTKIIFDKNTNSKMSSYQFSFQFYFPLVMSYHKDKTIFIMTVLARFLTSVRSEIACANTTSFIITELFDTKFTPGGSITELSLTRKPVEHFHRLHNTSHL